MHGGLRKAVGIHLICGASGDAIESLTLESWLSWLDVQVARARAGCR